MARPPALSELEMLGTLAQHPSVDGALDAVRELLDMDVAYSTRFDDGHQVFEQLRGDPASFGIHAGLAMPLDDTFCRHILAGNMAPIVPDMRLDPLGMTMPVTFTSDLGGFASVPLELSDGRLYGTLCCASHAARPLDERDEQVLHVLARMISGEIERAEREAHGRREQLQAASTVALVAAMQARDRYTSDHAHAVVEHAVRVAGRLGLSAAQAAEVEQVALLHDIGKLAVPDAVLLHPGPLDDGAWAVMRTHTETSEQIVASIPGLAHLAEAVRAEHEHWDGSGYPDGLAGEAIPIASRVALACDALHAMTSDRPYRPRMSRADAVAELRRHAGTQFDPRVVQALVETLEEPAAAA
jgi:hypothetical protein